MDERTLNDLLECSVCLERLDTSSKVLPCQHTFCRKCLEVIVNSRQELRCPECRVLVEVKIDELPPNVLLMRILEGLKNSTHNQNNTAKSQKPLVANSNSNNTGSNSIDINDSSRIIAVDQQIRASNEQNLSRRIVPHAFALYDFISKEHGDLNFKKGDIILLKRKIDLNWFIGELHDREGAFPINYVQIIVPLPVPQCVSLYDFKMGPNEEEGCLTFKKGTMINVLRRVDHNWAEGRIGSCIGIFPIAFVEMNNLAKQLLESGNMAPFIVPRCLPPVPNESNSSDSSSSTATTSPNSISSSNTSSNSAPNSPINTPEHNPAGKVKHVDTREKRHSLNALTVNQQLSAAQTNRHSAEILSIPEPNDCTATTSNNSPANATSTTVASVHKAGLSRPSDSQFQAQNQTQHTTRANVLKSSTHSNHVPSLPWAYVALYPYKPRKCDELELKKGCVYFVTERCLDGWYKGKNWADKSGVFPGNYVTPLRSRDQQQIIHQRKVSHNPHQQIITSPPSGSIQNHQNYVNTSMQAIPPPDLPPRSNAATPAAATTSVWAKPLGQQVENFFNRKLMNNGQRLQDSNPSMKSGNTNKDQNNQQQQQQPQQAHAQLGITKDKEKKESSTSSAVSLMKRLTNMKRSKSPPHSANPSYSMDNPVFEDPIPNSAPSSSRHNVMSHPVHVRSGSCPSQLLQSLPKDIGNHILPLNESHGAFGSQRVKGHKERTPLQGIRQKQDENISRNNFEISSIIGSNPNFISKSSSHNASVSSRNTGYPHSSSTHVHRKSQSLDANTISSQITGNSPGGKSSSSHMRERFRCIVQYPPNTDVELELNVGDIVFVHKKQKNGWYKGTHARTNKTGLFPASFVEPDL